MQFLEKTYKVAEHYFCVNAKEDFPFWPMMKECYGPFETIGNDNNPLFTITIDCSAIDDKKKTLIYSNQDDVKDEFISFSVFKKSDNSHYFELRQPQSSEINGCMHISSDLSNATLKVSGRDIEQWLTFNTAVSLCFHLASSTYNTLLLHASAVEYNGRAYLFLGKSGTGKSTHSRMWLKAIDRVTLMNDDHPIIRVWDNGDIIAYGSPWSGKTRCYKNIDAPLGGIIRIVRAMHNKAIRLSPIQSYASIMTSCGGMVWEKELADGRDTTIQQIISRIPCWNMECLPNEEAAIICSTEVTKVWAK